MSVECCKKERREISFGSLKPTPMTGSLSCLRQPALAVQGAAGTGGRTGQGKDTHAMNKIPPRERIRKQIEAVLVRSIYER